MAADGGTKAVVAALLANTGIAITKFAAFALTGFSSMLAEAIHSVADAGNQGLLLLGGKQAKKEATEEHPFGYGRERYIYAFIVAIVLFSVGGLFALYEAYHKYHEIQEGHAHLEDSWKQYVPLVVLAVAIVLESLSFRTAIIETNKVRGKASFATFIRRAKQPELPVILLEDLAALLGLVFAFVAVSALMLLTEQPVLRRRRHDADRPAPGGRRDHSGHRDQEPAARGVGAPTRRRTRIRAALEATTGFDRIIHLKTLHLGPEELLVAAKVGVARGVTADQIASAIDAAERAVREAEPLASVIYLEPDIYRADYVPAERPEPPPPAGH